MLAGIGLLVLVRLAWAAFRARAGHGYAVGPTGKAAASEPLSALDWPELQVRGVIPQPDEPSKVLLLVERPAHPQQRSVLLVAFDGSDPRPLLLLSRWCAARASISPARYGQAGLELRRRQSLERVYGFLVVEDTMPASLPGTTHRRRANDGQ